MADTALTIITDALVDIGVLADEETPTGSQATGALRKLNNMIDAWNINHLMVYGQTSAVLPLVSNQGIYTIGVGGNLNITRPNNIVHAAIRDNTLPASDRQDIPLYIFNDLEWAIEPFKGEVSNYPNNGVYFDNSFPLINTYLNPIPLTGNYSLVIWSSGIISNFNLTDVINLAPGYKRCLTANLCKEIAPSYGVQVPQSILEIAKQSMAELSINNFQLNEMQIDPYLAGNLNFDITTRRYT